ncbi:hypothetical protein HFO97_29705 [Rhizobium leguminosarum]|uniref:hypothetical protein n=1 Tax=Rhizobium leguminosarum TaxID=384 RepID=UPI001C989A00|nr:hypothetical protein [Rhizobium leguminosarum]MBY5364042.1 hypothetical protein [Rhizobium leguminosarum]
MDDEEEFTPRLKCDVDLEFVGPTGAVIDKWAADVLRALAERVEKGEFGDGFHEVKDRTGKPVGTIYLDYSQGDFG